MGREGVAYTFVSPEEGNELTRIEIRINRLLIRDEMPGFLAVPRPEPTEESRDARGRAAQAEARVWEADRLTIPSVRRRIRDSDFLGFLCMRKLSRLSQVLPDESNRSEAEPR
jgi:superfamily II DNA/RNA helicase